MLTVQQQALVDRVTHLLEEAGAEAVRLRREDHPASGSCAEIRRLTGSCSAAAIVGVSQLLVAEGTFRAGTAEVAPIRDAGLASPWNQIEAGMAIAMDLPILIVRSGIGDAGVFGMGHDSSTLTTLDVDEYGPVSASTRPSRSGFGR